MSLLPLFYWMSNPVPTLSVCEVSFLPHSCIPKPLMLVRTDIRIKRSEKVKLSWARTSEEGKQGGQCWLAPTKHPTPTPTPTL